MRFHIPAIPHTVTNSYYLSCFSSDTDIMTEKGWVSFPEYISSPQIYGKVATLNTELNIVEYQEPTSLIKNDYNGKMVHVSGQSIDLLVTPEHRLYVKTEQDKIKNRPFRFIEASSLPKAIYFKRDFPWNGTKEKIENFVLPSYTKKNAIHNFPIRPEKTFPMNDWLKLLGIYIAEGSVVGTKYLRMDGSQGGGHHNISIAQCKPDNRIIIEQWIKKLGFKYYTGPQQFMIHDVQLGDWFSQFGGSYDRYVPDDIKNLPIEQLKIFFDAIMLGDGTHYKELLRYDTRSKCLADDMHEIGLKLGYAVTTTTFPAEDGKPRYKLNFSEKQKTPKVYGKSKIEIYKGEVYCVSVPNELIYVRRNGKSCWAGNCPFTSKVPKMCQMLLNLGHEVYFYGCEGSDPPCTENVQIVTNAYRESFYPDKGKSYPQFDYDPGDDYHATFHHNCAQEIEKRFQEKDFLLCFWGFGHKPIADIIGPKITTVEASIGYSETFADFKVFESYAWMHWVSGRKCQTDGRFYDCVIPNFFDPNEFQYNEKREDWYLYLGRLVKTKGVELASELIKTIGGKLVIAGQGSLQHEYDGINVQGDHIQFEGYADVEKRKDLMSRAKALIMPTFHHESFGRTAIEAQISGCPVISTDHGSFNEVVLNGITGYRCHTLDQFVWAAKNIDTIKPQNCRDWAMNNFTLDKVAPMYQEYFDMLYDLHEYGWYTTHIDRENLNWLTKIYPQI